MTERSSDNSTRSNSKRILSGGGIAFIGQFFRKGFAFGTQILLAQFLGVQQYGLFTLGQTVVTILKTFSLMGLRRGVQRYLPIHLGEFEEDKARGVAVTALSVALVASILTSLGMLYFADTLAVAVFNNAALGEILKLFAFVLPLQVLTFLLAAIAQSLNRIDLQQAILAGQLGLGLVFIIVLVTAGLGIQGAILGLAIGSTLVVAGGFFVVFRELRIGVATLLNADFKVRKLLTFSFPLFLSSFSYMLMSRVDQLVIGAFRPSEAVGIYKAGVLLSAQLALFFIVATTAFSPMISDLHNQGETQQLDNLLKSISRWLLTLTIPMTVGIWYFAPLLLSFFGGTFTRGETVLIILSVYQTIRAGVGSTGEILQLTGYQNIVLADTSVAFVTNLALNLFLVPKFGIVGAAVATACSSILLEAVTVYQVYWYVGIHPFSIGTARALLVGGGLFIGTFGADRLLGSFVFEVLTFGVFCLVYMIVVWLIVFDADDRSLLTELVEERVGNV